MKKHLFSALVLLAVLAMLSGCGGGKYSDAVAVNNSFVDAMESYFKDLETADSSAAVATAVDAFAASIEKIAPRMKEMAEKYPELKDHNNQPEEFKAVRARADDLGKKMAGSMMKSMQYMNDAKVRDAQLRLQKAMMTMTK